MSFKEEKSRSLFICRGSLWHQLKILPSLSAPPKKLREHDWESESLDLGQESVSNPATAAAMSPEWQNQHPWNKKSDVNRSFMLPKLNIHHKYEIELGGFRHLSPIFSCEVKLMIDVKWRLNIPSCSDDPLRLELRWERPVSWFQHHQSATSVPARIHL